MSVNLEDYDEALRDAAPEVRDVLEATFLEASRVMSPAGLEEYLDRVRELVGPHLDDGKSVLL
jgi:restriction endonuclease Mrr